MAAPLAAVTGWVIGMLLQFHPMILSGLRRMQSDWGDTRLNNYILEHGYRWLRNMPGHERLWSPPVFFPAPNTAAYYDLLLGVAPFYWFWRIAGFAPDTSFQLWMLTVATLNFVAAFLLFSRGFRCRPLASAAGATLLSFAAVRTAQVMHAQLLPFFYVVIAIFALLRLFEQEPTMRAGVATVERRTRWVVVLAAACVAQLYSSYYYGWYLCFAMAIAALWAAVLPATRERLVVATRANLPVLGVSALAGALILAPLAMHFLQAARQVGMRDFSTVETMLPRAQSWAYMGSDSWLYGWLAGREIFHGIPMEHEQRLGLGIATAACAAFGLWTARHRRAIQFLTLVPLTMALLVTEWPGGFTLWHAIFALVPGAAALRAISRIGVAIVLPASLGIALLVDRLVSTREIAPSRTALQLQRRERRMRALAVAFLLVMVFAEQGQTPRSYDKRTGRARVARVAGQVGAECAAFLYTPLGGAEDPWWYHADAMWASMERAVPTLNGYAGSEPPGWPFYDVRVHTSVQDSNVTDSVAYWAARWRMDPRSICRVRTSPD